MTESELLELGDAFVELTRSGEVVRVNRKQETMFRTSRADSVGRVAWEVWPDTAALPYWSECRRALQQGIPVDFEGCYEPLGLWTATTAYPITSGGVAIYFRDIGAARRARDELRQREAEALAALEAERARLQTIIDTIPTGLIMLDEKGAMVIENPEWKRTWAGNALLNSVVDYESYKGFRPDTGERIGAEDWPCAVSLKQGVQTRDVILDIERFNGTRGTIVVSSSPMRDKEGRVIGAVAANMDISELRATQARLQDADRRKDEFIAMLSHELRNPLAPIRTSMYILDNAEPGSPQSRRAKEVIGRQVAHLCKLVDDLIEVTRVARGKIELRRSTLSVAATVRRAGQDYQALMAERGLELVLEVPDEDMFVDGDETRLAQVLGNLISNAVKFTPKGGSITVGVRRIGERARLYVRDTGDGIAPDVLPTIFEPFTQAKQTLARTEGGLGLGLALVKGLAELHGGSVGATSEAGAGTEFTVDLPLIQDGPEAGLDAKSEPAPRLGRARRVLVVDDNADAADSLADLVRLLGHEADVAHEGRRAIDLAQAQRYDVIFCDIGLPVMDGYEVAASLRGMLPTGTKIIAISGYAQQEDVKRSVAAGFDAHFAKPADPIRIERLLSE